MDDANDVVQTTSTTSSDNPSTAIQNTVTYELYLPDKWEEKLLLYQSYVDKQYCAANWEIDSFKLNIHHTEQKDPMLIGHTQFDGHFEDEWLVIYILYELTRIDPDLVVRVYDNDGNILLIEAAEHLPRWLNSKESDKRAFIYRKNLHVIPRDKKLDELDTCNGKLTEIQACANYIRNHSKTSKQNMLPNRTLANCDIQSAIAHQLSGLPDKNLWLERKLKFLRRVISDERESSDDDKACVNSREKSKRSKECLTLDKIAIMPDESLEHLTMFHHSIGDELRLAVKRFVANISKSFIVDWYKIVSETNTDFVVSIEALIEEMLLKLATFCIERIDKYSTGRIVTDLLHEHVLSESIQEKIDSIKSQINDHEYDICQDFVVRLYGLLCNNQFRRLIMNENLTSDYSDLNHNSATNDQGESQYNSSDNAINFNNRLTSILRNETSETSETSALYTLLIAMLTKSVFMPIVELISRPQWLYAVIIWMCDKEELSELEQKQASTQQQQTTNSNQSNSNGLSSRAANDKPTIKNMTTPLAPSIAINNRVCRSLDLEEGVDFLTPNINFDNPVCDSLKRPLDNIEIYSTEEIQTNNSCYVLYCIRYDGLCHRHPSAGANFLETLDMPVIDKRSSSNHSTIAKRVIESNSDAETSRKITGISSRKSFRRSMTIKRRFREFVILQLRLEENPKIRPYMKNIPKPTKLKAATQNIFSLPGITNIKLDQSTIKLRQKFLERFLIALNNSPFIANSYEFKEFFSYNVNSAAMNNISKSKSLILQVNLNKVFVESVRSAFSIIRATLPGDSNQLGTKNQPDPDEWLIELQQSTLKLHVQTRTSFLKMNLEKMLDSKLISMNEKPSENECYSRENINYYTKKLNPAQQQTRRGNNKTAQTIYEDPPPGTSSSTFAASGSSSSNQNDDSRAESTESIYYDAPDVDHSAPKHDSKHGDSRMQLLDTKMIPIAQKVIDIVHYSITRDVSCTKSTTNVIAYLLVGSMIERYATNLIEAGLNSKNVSLCINGITSAIWEEGDEPELDVEHASLDDAIKKLSRLMEKKCANHSYIPKKFIHSLIVKQLSFYLSQLGSMERNKFVIYSFFVQLISELESNQPWA